MNRRLVEGLNFHKVMRGEALVPGLAPLLRCSFCAAAVDEQVFAQRKACICELCVLVALTYYDDIRVQWLRSGVIDGAGALLRAQEDHRDIR